MRQMLNGVPHTYGVDGALDGVFEEVAGGDGDAHYVARIGCRMAGQVDPADFIEVAARQVEKEAVGRADFEQPFTMRRGHIVQQLFEPELELLYKERSFGDVIAVLLTLEIGGAVQLQ